MTESVCLQCGGGAVVTKVVLVVFARTAHKQGTVGRRGSCSLCSRGGRERRARWTATLSGAEEGREASRKLAVCDKHARTLVGTNRLVARLR